jgi:hypothetical protein
MKNPLYPSSIINYDTIRNYNNCFVITLEKTHVPTIFDKDIDIDFLDQINKNYEIKSVPMWMIRSVPEYKKKFIIFEISEDNLLNFKFNGADIQYNLVVWVISSIVEVAMDKYCRSLTSLVINLPPWRINVPPWRINLPP